jgi:hypothetical protein
MTDHSRRRAGSQPFFSSFRVRRRCRVTSNVVWSQRQPAPAWLSPHANRGRHAGLRPTPAEIGRCSRPQALPWRTPGCWGSRAGEPDAEVPRSIARRSSSRRGPHRVCDTPRQCSASGCPPADTTSALISPPGLDPRPSSVSIFRLPPRSRPGVAARACQAPADGGAERSQAAFG